MKLKSLSPPDDGLDARLLEIEKAIGAFLPEDYIRFLHRMNGAKPSKPLKIEISGGRETDLQLIYGSGEHLQRALRLEFWLDEEAEKRGICVANDSGGSVFRMSLEEKDYGAVYFEDRNEIDEPFQVAANWTAFLEL